MSDNPVITLTTDFGYKDPFVGIMKGVILSINPSAMVVDITHDISPHNICEASFVIAESFSYFPHRTIHVVVVDPGVGSIRRPLLIVSGYHYFIGPDNGIFSRIYNSAEGLQVINITSEHYFLPERGKTFHGRDIFAPAAAWLSRGLKINNFGDPVSNYVTLPIPETKRLRENMLVGEVIYVDRFGNLITNISSSEIESLTQNNSAVEIKVSIRDKEAPFKKHYAEASNKEISCLINSFGLLELFVKEGSASSAFGISVGEKVSVDFS